MRFRTQQYQYEDGDDFYGNNNRHHLSPPSFTNSPLIKVPKNHSTTKKKKKMKKKLASSTSQSLSKSDQKASGSNPDQGLGNWSLGSLMAALPLSPSPICTSPTGSRSPPSPLPCEASRTSVEFYTPTHQSSSVFSSVSFKKQEQSPKCMSISTVYESALDHGYRQANHGLLQNYTFSPKSSLNSAPTHHPFGHESSSIAIVEADDPAIAVKRGADDFARAEPVTEDRVEINDPSPVNRPKPYQEFLDEIQKHKHRAELDAQRKAAYTDLLNKLKRKEAVIDCWESSQRSKAEFELDRIERKLDKKRAIAVQKMHQKVAKAKMEAESRKARERRSILKEMAKLSQKVQRNKLAATMLCHP